MIGLWNVNFLNQNMQRAYPLTIESTKQCSLSQDIVIPDDFLLAMRISVNASMNLDITGFFVKNIIVMSTGCTVTIGYKGEDTDSEDVAIVHVLKDAEQITYTLTGVGNFDDISGFIAINTKSKLFRSVGSFPFDLEDSSIEPDCITPSLRSIRSIAINDGVDTSARIYGDVILQSGANVSITTNKTEQGTTYIKISAVASSDYEEGCDCNACDCDSEREPIQTINGVGPDTSGNIDILGTHCLTVATKGSCVALDDTCATPGCTCEQLNDMAAELKDLKDGAKTLDTFVNNMYTQVATASTVITGSGPGGSCKVQCESNNGAQ